MAGIDKTYVTADQLMKVISWADSVYEVTLPNGYKFKPTEFICWYDEIKVSPESFFNKDEDCYILWNTPIWFDKWLALNCPFDFIHERLLEQYGEDELAYWKITGYSKASLVNPNLGKQKYKVLKKPIYGDYRLLKHGSYNHRFRKLSLEITVDNMCGYDAFTDRWYGLYNTSYPCNDSYYWYEHHTNIPTTKSILRQLRKWWLPSGTIVIVKSPRWEFWKIKVI